MSETDTEVKETSTYKPLKVPSRGYVRKRGTKEIFAYTEQLMMRGDMIPYEGAIPVPTDFIVPRAEIEIVEAIRKAEEGKLEPMQRSTTAVYLRKIGTKEIFVATPTLFSRGDMIPYDGMIPVPEGFIIPPQELDILAFIGNKEVPIAPIFEAEKELETEIPKEPVMDSHQVWINKLVDAIGKLEPQHFSYKTGLPDARQITKILGGKQVKKGDRDEAFELYKLLNPVIEPVTETTE